MNNQMRVLRGIPVSPGVTIGPALILDVTGLRIPPRHSPPQEVDRELERFHRAVEAAVREVNRQKELVTAKLGPESASIFSAHVVLLRDPGFSSRVERLIREDHYTAEYAVSRTIQRFIDVLQQLKTPIASRAGDLRDIGNELLRHLIGAQRQELKYLEDPVVILAADLSPAETARLDTSKVLGFATELGGRTSHTAIVAGSLEIPAVVGVEGLLSSVFPGDRVIIDGNQGVVVINPDQPTLERYERALKRFKLFTESLATLRSLPAETKDGTRIALLGNIEFPREVHYCLRQGAEGIGLYRTEFLFLERDTPPTEEEHYEAYREVIRAVGGRPVVIRTLDLGADKLPGNADEPRERNPFLGLRSIRLCLRRLALFKTQLRAILRASMEGPVSLMFPMVSTLLELRQAKLVLAEVMEDLADQGVPYRRDIKVGIMVEVPSTAIMADYYAREVDFFSLGTNDLTQYVLAVDRGNEKVANLYSPVDPAVLRLIRRTIIVSRRRKIPINICGEMCGDPLYTMLLIGLGVRSMSAAPHSLPELKQTIRSVSVEECEKITRRVMMMENARDVEAYLRGIAREKLPELFE